MDEKLKSLKRAMDHTVFKQTQFNAEHMASVRKKIKKKRSFHLLPAIVATLFISISIVIISLSLIDKDQNTASYITETHDLENIFFENQRNGGHRLLFTNNELTVSIDSSYSRSNPNAPGGFELVAKPSETIYSNISVKTEGDTYFIYSDNELIMTLQKIAPRIVKDSEGNTFSTPFYLSSKLAIEITNKSNIDIDEIELISKDGEELNTVAVTKSNNAPISTARMEIDRNDFHKTIELTVKLHLSNNDTVILDDSITLESTYDDFYSFNITGDTQNKLEIKQE